VKIELENGWQELANIWIRQGKQPVFEAPLPLEQWLAAKAGNVIKLNPFMSDGLLPSYIAFDEIKGEQK
jgi:hypothetical protein